MAAKERMTKPKLPAFDRGVKPQPKYVDEQIIRNFSGQGRAIVSVLKCLTVPYSNFTNFSNDLAFVELLMLSFHTSDDNSNQRFLLLFVVLISNTNEIKFSSLTSTYRRSELNFYKSD